MKRKTRSILSIAAGALGLFIAIGVKTFLHPCVHEDGTEAMCQAAGQLIFWIGIAMALLGSGLTGSRGGLRIALSCGLILLCVLLILAPGTLRPVCAMAGMRCRTVTQPAARVTGILAAVLAGIALIGDIRGRGADK